MNPDPFEPRLAATPLRDLPPFLRTRVLAAAESRARRWAWFWPHPLAWAAVVAGWMAIASLHFAGPTAREASTFVPPGETPPEVSTESYLAHVRVREIYLAGEEPMIRLDRSKL